MKEGENDWDLLKDMGNSLLGRFGMSVDNFKTQEPTQSNSKNESLYSIGALLDLKNNRELT
ncbi:unnamed protein product [Rhodiola kirilowii]